MKLFFAKSYNPSNRNEHKRTSRFVTLCVCLCVRMCVSDQKLNRLHAIHEMLINTDDKATIFVYMYIYQVYVQYS